LTGNIGNNFVKIFWDILDSDGLEIEIVKNINKKKIWEKIEKKLKEIKNRNYEDDIDPKKYFEKIMT